jgi:ABC-2 type transport system permease protein
MSGIGQFLAFTKKEFFESAATFRLYILLVVFLVLGMMSPLVAKMMPEIANLASGITPGFSIQMPEPTVMDAWVQFFKNIGQMGMLALVILFGGLMSNELSKGTLINLLTKGLKRRTVITSKFIAATLLWTLAYLVCLGVCYAYTAYFWEIGSMPHALLAFFALWLFGELLLSLLLFGGTLFGSIYGSLLSCLGAVLLLSLVSIMPSTAKYNPMTLAGGTLALLSGAAQPEDFIPAVIVSLVVIAALVIGSVLVFDRKKL